MSCLQFPRAPWLHGLLLGFILSFPHLVSSSPSCLQVLTSSKASASAPLRSRSWYSISNARIPSQTPGWRYLLCSDIFFRTPQRVQISLTAIEVESWISLRSSKLFIEWASCFPLASEWKTTRFQKGFELMSGNGENVRMPPEEDNSLFVQEFGNIYLNNSNERLYFQE